MRTITVPLSLMVDTAVSWDIDWRGQSSGETNSGSRQIVYNAFPRWVGRPKLALVGEQIAQWRAIRARAQGRRSVYRVPMIDPLSFDYSLISASVRRSGRPDSYNGRLTTGMGFQYAPFCPVVPEPEGVIDGAGAGTLPAAGSQHVWVDTGPAVATPKIGGIYSANDLPFIATEVHQLSELVRVDDYIASSGDGVQEAFRQTQEVYRMSVEMPLRAPLTESDVVSLVPYGLFFSETDDNGRLEYGLSLYSNPEFSFLEWLR